MSESQKLIKLINQSALGGKKIPHGVSNPVFRMDESGKIQVAAFVYTFSAEELRTRNVKRPAYWMTVDVKNANKIMNYRCSEHDFCNISFDTKCDLNADTDTAYSIEYKRQTLAVFDLILRKYINTGVFDYALNDAYMFMMLRMVSVGFKEFYKSLNNMSQHGKGEFEND